MRFLKGLCFALALICGICRVSAAEAVDTLTARYVFTDLDSDILSMINRTTRLDMLDYYDVHRPFSPLNDLGATCRLDTLTRTYAKIMVTDLVTVEIKILPYKKGSLAAISYTVDADGADSELLFFDEHLKQLPTKKFFKELSLENFIDSRALARYYASQNMAVPKMPQTNNTFRRMGTNGQDLSAQNPANVSGESLKKLKKEAKELMKEVPFLMIEYSFRPSDTDTDLYARIIISSGMPEDISNKLKPVLRLEPYKIPWKNKYKL